MLGDWVSAQTVARVYLLDLGFMISCGRGSLSSVAFCRWFVLASSPKQDQASYCNGNDGEPPRGMVSGWTVRVSENWDARRHWGTESLFRPLFGSFIKLTCIIPLPEISSRSTATTPRVVRSDYDQALNASDLLDPVGDGRRREAQWISLNSWPNVTSGFWIWARSKRYASLRNSEKVSTSSASAQSLEG